MKIVLAALLFTLASVFNNDALVLICVSPTASKYHSHKCQGLAKCTHKIEDVSISEARNRGYTPCGFCY